MDLLLLGVDYCRPTFYRYKALTPNIKPPTPSLGCAPPRCSSQWICCSSEIHTNTPNLVFTNIPYKSACKSYMCTTFLANPCFSSSPHKSACKFQHNGGLENGWRRRLWNVRQNHCLGAGGGAYFDVTSSSPLESSHRIWACTEEDMLFR